MVNFWSIFSNYFFPTKNLTASSTIIPSLVVLGWFLIFFKNCAGRLVEGQKLNYRYDTDQWRVLIRRQNFTLINRTPDQGYHRVTLESASPQQSTVLTEKAGSPKRPLQLCQTVSSSTLPNSLVRFWFLKLWVICNPKNSTLKINTIQYVYVELCYKNLT